MNVSCPECRSVFRVDPTKLPSTTVRARCSVCGGVITINAGSSIEDEFSGNAASAPSAARANAEASVGARANAGLAVALLDTFAVPTPHSPTPAAQAPVVPPGVPSRTPTPAASAPATVTKPLNSNPAPAAPAGARPVLFPPRPMMPGNAPAPAATGFTARPLVAPRSLAPSVRSSPPPAAASPPPSRPTGATANAVPHPATVPSTVPSPTAMPIARPAPAPAPSGAGAPTPARSPINPFLANDPHAKAKRLARALVSDLVTYFPQKRQDGLRDGTLKQLFKDEIQKSYEEYVSQIGREFAESTPHFQEALNDLLAGGQKVF